MTFRLANARRVYRVLCFVLPPGTMPGMVSGVLDNGDINDACVAKVGGGGGGGRLPVVSTAPSYTFVSSCGRPVFHFFLSGRRKENMLRSSAKLRVSTLDRLFRCRLCVLFFVVVDVVVVLFAHHCPEKSLTSVNVC